MSAAQVFDRPDGVGAADKESHEAKEEHGMAEAGAEVLPEGGTTAGIIGRKKQRQHENAAAHAGRTHQDTENERDADGEFAVGHQKRDRRGVREHEPAKHRHHEGVSSAIEKPVDPILKAAVKRELRAENFVFAKDQEENAGANTQHRKSAGIDVSRGRLWLQ